MEQNRFVKLASHAIGLDRNKPYKRHGRFFYRPYRNYYAASPKDAEIWMQMVEEGYAEAGRQDRYGCRMFWLTRSGLDWLGKKLNITIHDEAD